MLQRSRLTCWLLAWSHALGKNSLFAFRLKSKKKRTLLKQPSIAYRVIKVLVILSNLRRRGICMDIWLLTKSIWGNLRHVFSLSTTLLTIVEIPCRLFSNSWRRDEWRSLWRSLVAYFQILGDATSGVPCTHSVFVLSGYGSYGNLIELLLNNGWHCVKLPRWDDLLIVTGAPIMTKHLTLSILVYNKLFPTELGGFHASRCRSVILVLSTLAVEARLVSTYQRGPAQWMSVIASVCFGWCLCIWWCDQTRHWNYSWPPAVLQNLGCPHHGCEEQDGS